MREDFDYVTMANYKADRAEEAERQLQEAKALIAELVIAAGGTITIPGRLGWRPCKLTTWRTERDDTITFEAEPVKAPLNQETKL